MPVLLTCSGCQKSLRVPDTTRGKKIRCPVCQTVLAVPSEAPEAKEDVVRPAAVQPELRPPPSKNPASPPPSPAKSEPARPEKPARGIQETKTRSRREEIDELEEEEDLPPEDFDPLEFRVAMVKDSDKELKGFYQTRLSPEGLQLLKGKKELLHVPVGMPTEHIKGAQLAITLDDRRVTFNLVGFGWYHKRLARDTAAFLNGESAGLDPRGYRMPWYLILPALPPIGIPIMTLGGALPGAIGFGLAGACFVIMQQEEWPTVVRVLLCLLLAAVGYAGVIALILFLHTSNLLGH